MPYSTWNGLSNNNAISGSIPKLQVKISLENS